MSGKVLFIAPDTSEDQLMCYGGEKNLSYDLWEARKKHSPSEDQWIHLSNSDHWTIWSAAIDKKVHRFLGIEASISDFPTNPISPSLFQRNILPYLIKSWL